jgi:integration host factor subunit beta
MTKSQLMQELLKRSNIFSQQDAVTVVNEIFSTMTQALAKGEKVEVRDFGIFKVRSYQSYQGRNPRTGDKVEVAPKKLPHFRVGKELKERVDNPISG